MSTVANVAINVDARNATAQLRQLQGQAGQTERAFGGLTAAVGKLAVAATAIQAARFVFAKTAELETQTRSLQVLTGSAEKAKAIIQDLQRLGAVTPFTSTELIDSAKRLQAFGVEANKVVETTKRLADVSGATGAELQGLVTAYGQVQAKGRLQGEELLQFQERGVALQEELRKMYGLSGEEFQKAMSKGQVSAEAVEIAVKRLTDAGGRYANGAIAQSDTLAGKLSTLQDAFEQLARNIGKFFEPVFKFLIDGVNAFLERVNNAARIGNEIAARQEAGIRTRSRFGLRSINPFDQEVQQYRQNVERSLFRTYQSASSQTAAQSGIRVGQQVGAIPPLLGAAGGGGGGGRSGNTDAEREAEKAREEEQRRQSAVRSIKAETELLEIQVAIKEQIAAAERGNRPIEALRLKGLEKEVALQAKYAKLLADPQNQDARIQAALFDQATQEFRANAFETETDVNNLLDDRIDKFNELMNNMAAEQALLELGTPELRARFDLEKQIVALQNDGTIQNERQLEQYRLANAQLEKARKLQAAIASQLQMQEDLFQGIAMSLVGGISAGIDAVTDSTKSLGESLKNIGSDILKTVGKMMIFYALAQTFGALAGGNSKSFLGFMAQGFGFKFAQGGYVPGGFQAFADGGMVSSPTLGLVGEGGQPEYIIPASKMRSAMNRYAAGARGSAVIPAGNEGDGAIATATAAPASIDVRYTVERINSVDYVTADQFQRGMQQAATQGAQRGEQATLRRLQQSSSTRRRLGM